MNDQELLMEDIQLSLLLEAINLRYGYDFSSYARSSLKRRINDYIESESIESYYELIKNLIENKVFFDYFIKQITVNVTEAFRDPVFYRHLREKVIPILKTYPSIKVWHAGCATGEEPLSLAILLYEEGLLDRTKIYATDISESAIETALNGIYSFDKIKKYTENYNHYTGKKDFSDYYYVRYNEACICKKIREHISFFKHNLVTDNAFGTFNLIFCRNVLIYFNRELQDKVLVLLKESLDHYGYLCLGMKETLSTSSIENEFDLIDLKTKIYRKKVPNQ